MPNSRDFVSGAPACEILYKKEAGKRCPARAATLLHTNDGLYYHFCAAHAAEFRRVYGGTIVKRP